MVAEAATVYKDTLLLGTGGSNCMIVTNQPDLYLQLRPHVGFLIPCDSRE